MPERTANRTSQRPTIIITGANSRLANSLQQRLGDQFNFLKVSRNPAANCQSWQQFFDQPVPTCVDSVWHFAWSQNPYSAERATDSSLAHDLQLLQKLCTHLSSQPTPPAFLFPSSGSVYGSTTQGAAKENHPKNPLSRYAKTKLQAEQILRQQVNLPSTILRISNPYAIQHIDHIRQGVIAHLIHCAQTSTPFEQWGENPTKDYLHCDDLASSLALIHKHQIRGTWNISSGTGTDLLSIIALVEQHLQRPLKRSIQAAPAWDASPNILDSSALSAATGWHPQHQLPTYIKKQLGKH